MSGARVLVAMSGGVDSSVAAGLLVQRGFDVTGATLKLWGGPSDSGCCSVGDVEDARRVAQQLGIPHHVFNMSDEFEAAVVRPYVEAHAAGRTPNPCIECNRRIKFDVLVSKARRLGFDALATGHHARVSAGGTGGAPATWRLRRGVDPAKDQSYVLSMLDQRVLSRLLLPIGELTKAEVRHRALELGLRTAQKPDSQDVCFIRSTEGRDGFLGARLELHPAEIVDLERGMVVGSTGAVELVTVGQRRGMGHDARGRRRYVARVDVARRRVEVGCAERVACREMIVVPGSISWVADPPPSGSSVLAQLSAHGRPCPAVLERGPAGVRVRFDDEQRPVAPGQTVALYRTAQPDEVIGGGIAA
jgi:tRNA-uridine 2-sulfurtransferase